MAASFTKSIITNPGLKSTLSKLLPANYSNDGSTKFLTALYPAVTQVRHKNNKQRVRAPNVDVKKEDKFTPKNAKKKVLSEVVEETSSIIAEKPIDNVWITKLFPKQHFSIEETIKRHKAFAQPSMLNNLKGIVYLDMKLNCTTKKSTKFISPIRSTVRLPYEFPFGSPPDILIFCKTEENLNLAESLGPKHFGTPADIIKMINSGVINPSDFEHVLATPDCATELLPIRSYFRERFPQRAKGTLNSDLQAMWDLYYYGYTYESQKITDSLGRLQVPLGMLEQPTEELAANFKAYIDHICKHKSVALGPFISSITVVAPPSLEQFLVKVEDYVPGYKNEQVDSDEEEDEVEAVQT
ncbi:39S ribosomal protein L1 mitochondrial [Biomphalaria pfeifferi]|uniref:39S ribosomal protein L1 mitochondrial n=1 Tax=Biomphalaria pfeifferi TaxID=112525 RepID=A0AAD8AWN3_BIOPF|nr:39S ribosomal protein L1 mitochondrial [Biomphalaria pfeifferi]